MIGCAALNSSTVERVVLPILSESLSDRSEERPLRVYISKETRRQNFLGYGCGT